jgi:hypothetical protein
VKPLAGISSKGTASTFGPQINSGSTGGGGGGDGGFHKMNERVGAVERSVTSLETTTTHLSDAITETKGRISVATGIAITVFLAVAGAFYSSVHSDINEIRKDVYTTSVDIQQVKGSIEVVRATLIADRSVARDAGPNKSAETPSEINPAKTPKSN